jgi:hypothetical protein
MSRWFGECEQSYPESILQADQTKISRIHFFDYQKSAPSESPNVILLNMIFTVCLILGLIIAGLVIDLGGGPKKDRIGFRVRI